MIKGFKGFTKDLKCRDFQFEVGKEYEEAKAIACETGFHFCEYPLDVFRYYAPADSRFCEVEGDGEIDKHDSDSKVAVTKIKIGAEIKLPGLIQAGVQFIMDRVSWGDDKGSNKTEAYSAATNTGDQSAATVEGEESVAISLGIEGKAKGALGCWLTLAEWNRDENYDWHRIDVQTAKVDGETIKADTWYRLEDGQFVEAVEEEE